MKMIKFIPFLFLTALLFSSCVQQESETIECDFTEEVCKIVPFCTWPPSPDATIQLPVAFQYNGDFVSHENYQFNWSSDPDFGSGAIGLFYDDLPVTVTVIEIATGCEVEVTLSAD